MGSRFSKGFLPVRLAAAAMAACLLAACDRAPDCEQARETGEQVAELGLPGEADRSEIHADCRDAYEEGWSDGRERFCDPEGAFELGLSDQVHYGICEAREFRAGFELGRTLRVLRAEQEALALQLEAIEDGRHQTDDPDQRAWLERRDRILEREISELETLARIRGHLDPAELPPELADP